jgi:hypothetical protein
MFDQTNSQPSQQNVDSSSNFETNPNLNENAKAMQLPVADANCRDFHYTQAEIDSMDQEHKKRLEAIDIGLRKHNGFY